MIILGWAHSLYKVTSDDEYIIFSEVRLTPTVLVSVELWQYKLMRCIHVIVTLMLQVKMYFLTVNDISLIFSNSKFSPYQLNKITVFDIRCFHKSLWFLRLCKIMESIPTKCLENELWTVAVNIFRTFWCNLYDKRKLTVVQ